KVTYTATDEAGNVGTRSKTIKCRNISEFYAGKYSTTRDRDAANLNLAISNDTTYYSTISAANNVAGRLRFPKVACHTYNGQTVSFKVDADLYSPEFSPSSASAQIGYLGTAADKEVPVYKGLSYEDAVDSVRYKYTYLQISAQNYVYSDSDQAINDYNVDIKGHKENGRPTSKIVYDERGTMLRIELELEISLNNNVFNGVYREIYMLE
ncbi:MAG: hypothetical protein HUK15_05610, partial [Bacteroidales bacterium]|nr:hypothetical protein [Bacteroidales bacterium]